MCQAPCSGLYTHDLVNPQPPSQSCITTISILRVRTLRLREMISLAHVHTENAMGPRTLSLQNTYVDLCFILILRIRIYYIVIS